MPEIELPRSGLELDLLCAIVHEPTILDEAAFRTELFSTPAHQLMFNRLVAMFEEHGVMNWEYYRNSFNLKELSEAGGLNYLSDMWGRVPTSSGWDFYYRDVLKCYRQREGWKVATGLASKMLDKDLDLGDESVPEFIERTLSQIAFDQPIPEISDHDMLQQAWINVINRKPGQGMIELSSIRALNLALGCLLPGEEIVIGAETSFGKTSLAMHFVSHLCFGTQQKKVAMFSMEMRSQAMNERFFASQGHVPLDNIRRNDFMPEQYLRIEKFIESVDKDQHNIFMDDDSSLDIRAIVSRCRRIKKKFGLDAAVIDYLQLVSPANLKASANRQQEVADISRRLKNLAVELNIVVIALSQVNEAGQLRESRAIGQDADVVMYIREAKESEDKFEKTIYIEKNRNGPRGKAPVDFYEQYVSFADKS